MKRLIKMCAKQVGTLYHFTTLTGLIDILKSNSLKGKPSIGVCLTRNKAFTGINLAKNETICARISLDGNLISENNKITPVNHLWSGKNDWTWDEVSNKTDSESEERVLTLELQNLNKYITDITIFVDAVSRDKNGNPMSIFDMASKYGLELNDEESFKQALSNLVTQNGGMQPSFEQDFHEFIMYDKEQEKINK